MSEDPTIPDSVLKKATNIIRDARLAVLVGLIPILGLAYVGRLVEWYLLRRQCPVLASDPSPLATNFRSAAPRLWFGALCWPVVVLLLCIYVWVT